jgi:hypothetical protein
MTKEQTTNGRSVRVDCRVRFFPVAERIPKPWRECLIWVSGDYGKPLIYYGAHDGTKWVAAMPWDSCDGNEHGCVELCALYGEVIAWAKLPKPNV